MARTSTTASALFWWPQLDVINADTAPSKQQLAIFYLDELAASTSPSSVIERWRARALSRELSVAQREQAYFRLKDLATAAGRQDIVATFPRRPVCAPATQVHSCCKNLLLSGAIRQRCRIYWSPQSGAMYLSQNEHKPIMRIRKPRCGWNNALRSSASCCAALAGNTLASKEQDLYEYDLERLGSPALVLKYLATQLLRANHRPRNTHSLFLTLQSRCKQRTTKSNN